MKKRKLASSEVLSTMLEVLKASILGFAYLIGGIIYVISEVVKYLASKILQSTRIVRFIVGVGVIAILSLMIIHFMNCSSRNHDPYSSYTDVEIYILESGDCLLKTIKEKVGDDKKALDICWNVTTQSDLRNYLCRGETKIKEIKTLNELVDSLSLGKDYSYRVYDSEGKAIQPGDALLFRSHDRSWHYIPKKRG